MRKTRVGKEELAISVAVRTGAPVKIVKDILETLLTEIKMVLMTENASVILTNYFTITSVSSPERYYTMPNGTKVKSKKKRKLKIKASKNFFKEVKDHA